MSACEINCWPRVAIGLLCVQLTVLAYQQEKVGVIIKPTKKFCVMLQIFLTARNGLTDVLLGSNNSTLEMYIFNQNLDYDTIN